MDRLDEVQHRITFGPFEMNSSTGELRKGGIPMHLPGQPSQILLMLLACPRELVTREQLREQIWKDGTFVDFEQGLYAAINKLRRALNDSADKPRYIETVPGRGYRFIGVVERRPHMISVPAAPALPERIGHKHRHRFWVKAAFGVACATLAVALGWKFHGTAAQPPWKFTRLTTDGGLSDTPALSPDGKLVAYSSDHGVSGQQDIYIKHVGAEQPIRLTFDGAGNTTPDFSPDGSSIAFRSNRNGGGIYEVPVFGGHIRLMAQGGLNPRFSPDGTQVAYWTGAESVAEVLPGSGAVWIIPVVGGRPHRVGQNLSAARYPIWAPDGKRLLVVGYSSQRGFDNSAIDWWLVAANGSEAIRTGAHDAIIRAGLQLQPDWRTPVPIVPAPSCWSKDNAVVFSTRIGDTQNLWEINVSPETGKVNGPPKRLTAGSGNEMHPSCSSSGALAFANVEANTDIWLLPFDLNAGSPKGMLERISERALWRETVSLARNGRYIAFASYQSGQQSIWRHDLETREELTVARSPFAERYPVSNASGDRIAFSVYEKDKRAVYVSEPGGAPVKLCEGCLRATDWSHNEAEVLVFGGDPYEIDVLDIASRRRIPLIKHRRYPVLYGRFSPDNRWISFTARVQPGRGRITLARMDGLKLVPETAWIAIAEAGADDYANWSPDGETLYFTASRDGYSCLWGQRLDSISKRPVGQAFAVQHLHGRLSFGHGGWSAGRDRIAIALVEKTGNVWMMSRSGGQ